MLRYRGRLLSQYVWGLSLSFLNACYDEIEAPPVCFESTEIPEYDPDRLMKTYQIGVSGYCATDRMSCLEIWTGDSEVYNKPEFYAYYPYLSLIEEEPVSEGSPFSLCQIPETCDEPSCQCVTTADCELGSVCVGDRFLSSQEPTPNGTKVLTSCLPICGEDSACQRGEVAYHCLNNETGESCFSPAL